MQFITPEILDQLDINLSPEERQSLLAHLSATLEERIGQEVTDALDDEQLDELVQLQQTADETQLGAWLQANVPDLQEIIQDEVDILLGELAENSDQLK